jgi:hypothetical protein
MAGKSSTAEPARAAIPTIEYERVADLAYQLYLYADAGIREKHGSIPLWLKLVAVALLIWSVYYLIQFWSF